MGCAVLPAPAPLVFLSPVLPMDPGSPLCCQCRLGAWHPVGAQEISVMNAQESEVTMNVCE